ncbi:hypothetical protein GKG18_14885 [Escherichia coli]|uniref:Phage protein n=1 Tax=Escherichia coli TaxID=562 RepID=A0A6D0WJ92_ECOLX|nr:hypothetical protein [Escherichia coli]KAA3082131.1 hypothetical protein F2Q58_13985 [Alistipes onderdonkii]KAB5959768.1 hypothetical protein GA602_08705 [Bifidobacterium adolescentis]KAB6705167.1 hypothetical protein GAY15_23980 [Phocaeicola vulgatus]EJA4712143.1 hypothetical protein [Escherichia coli]EJF0982430.1 hypothetical protein [Escherichia coli]
MSTFTDKEMIKEIKERIGSLDVRDNIERRAYEIALASLEAEPVAKIIAHYPLGIDVGKQKFVQAIGELPDFGGHLFAAPPAAVVPDDGREKFEALVRFHAGDKNHETLLLRANEGMNYQDPNVDLAWIFWKSSREHI